jgi:epoxyqueuosine reductase
VIVVAMSYRCSLPDSGSFDPEDGRVWVSRYAWGRDYHKIIRKRLTRLGRWLGEQRPGSSWRTCVDTSPILEREWAARAGLGWIGKNTMVMNRRLGSELFLGVLLTDIPFRADKPAPEHCGTCTACLDACPTGALVKPRVLDARRCIAYLTVEHRAEIPREIEPSVSTMIAGCDICQEVCPWTRKGAADLHEEFSPAAGRFRPRLRDLVRFTEQEYRAWRRGSALNRISFKQFRRNLTIARRNATGTR